ncbi:MAG: hypothetical protein LRZ87_00140 [Methanocellales archaeon]|nr:hypothetical protein [Methanocellales archaeon]
MAKEDNVSINRSWQLGRGIGKGDMPRVISPEVLGKLIKKAKRPLYVFGPSLLEAKYNGKLALDYAIEMAEAHDVPVVAVSHAIKGFLQKGFEPDAWMPAVNIVDRLRDSEWNGIRKEGQHDLVVLFGVFCALGEQGLSTLRHFAPHLRTITICPRYHPSADMSIIIDGEKLNKLVETLRRD